MTKKIAIDFDSVLANTVKRWTEIFNAHHSEKYHDLHISYNKIREFSIGKYFGISSDDVGEIFNQCWQQWDTLEPMEFALAQKIKTLRGMHDGLDIVTAAPQDAKQNMTKFLKKHGIKYDSIICEENKETLDHTTYIDDSPHMAEKIFRAGKTALLYTQPWNIDIMPRRDGDVHLTRIYGIDHAIHVLSKL